MVWAMAWRGLLALGLVAGLAACGSSAPPPRPTVAAPDALAVCLKGLDKRHVVYERVQDWTTPEGCGIQGAIRVKRDASEWARPLLMTCSLETSLADYETQVVQPAIQKYFHQGLRRITNAGTYNCRAERSDHNERLSQHAYGKAIDITGFELEDGTKISVMRDWRGKGEKSEFLHDVAKGACGLFNVVLTPNYNALHHDHLHLDVGPHKLCGV